AARRGRDHVPRGRARDERHRPAALAPRRRAAAPPDRHLDRSPGALALAAGHGRRRLVSRRGRRGEGCAPPRPRGPELARPPRTARPLRRRPWRRAAEPVVDGARRARGGVSATVWYAARAGGVLAYLLLSTSVVLGMSMSRRGRLVWPKFAVEDVHRFLTILTGSFLAVHVGG